jgi:hypothetical protein
MNYYLKVETLLFAAVGIVVVVVGAVVVDSIVVGKDVPAFVAVGILMEYFENFVVVAFVAAVVAGKKEGENVGERYY